MRSIWKAILFSSGALILALTVPHDAPWSMRLIQISPSGRTTIEVDLLSHKLPLSAEGLFKSLALLFGGLILIHPSARSSLKALARRPWRLLALLLSLGYLAFTLIPTRAGWGIVLYLILGSTGIALIMIGISPLLDRLMPRLIGIGASLRRAFEEAPRPLLLFILFSTAFAATNLGSYFLFEHIPHIQDSIDQVFHGKIFLLGRLTVPSPELREFFDFTHMINNGRWYSIYPPGHSLLMALGHLIHAPWVINPLFGSLCVVLIYFIGREMFDERTGRLAALLGAVSPFLIFMSSEFMNHTTTLFFVELFILGFVRMLKRRRARDAALTGFGLGYALNIRPLTAVAVGSPFALFALYRLLKAAFRSGREAIGLGLLCLTALSSFGLMLGGLLAFNYLTNGDPLLFGYEVLYGEGHRPGFGHSGWGEPHTPKRGLIQTLNNLNALNKYLFELPIPSLLPALLALCSPGVTAWDLLLLGYASSLALAYFFYWFQDWCFGPRFLFESTAAFALLAARGLIGLPRIARELLGIGDERRVKAYAAVALLICFGLGLCSNLPALVRLYSNSYWGVNGQVLKAVEEMGIRNAVIFVRSYYGSVFAANSPLLDSEVIYVRDLGDERNVELMRRFPGRKFYIANGPEILPYNPPESGD